MIKKFVAGFLDWAAQPGGQDALAALFLLCLADVAVQAHRRAQDAEVTAQSAHWRLDGIEREMRRG